MGASEARTAGVDPQADAGTRQQVLQLVAGEGPITTADLAARLDLTAAGIRRHLALLESTGQIAVHEGAEVGPVRRGRPARRYVVTSTGQTALSHRYAEIAAQALRFLAEAAGPGAVEDFAERRVAELEQRLARRVDGVPADDVAARAEAIAQALSDDGYAASARPVPGTHAVQLCQGHCPVQDVAHEFPQLCDAEARAFSRLLGVHVQRLATLAGGGHVCTTNIPVIASSARTTDDTTTTPNPPVLAPEGTNA